MIVRNTPKTKSNSAIAVEKLRELIFTGTLPAGSNHLESELALRLGMSRTPVREAVVTLEAQGLVAVQARRGVRVLPISIRDMEEIYDVLTALESMAAGQAAERGYAVDDLRNLQQTMSDMDAALAREDREAWALADDRFHEELVRLGGNGRVSAIVALMADQVRRAKAVTLYLRPLPVKSNADHRRVLDAIMRGDAAEAKHIHHVHRASSKETLMQLLKQSNLPML